MEIPAGPCEARAANVKRGEWQPCTCRSTYESSSSLATPPPLSSSEDWPPISSATITDPIYFWSREDIDRGFLSRRFIPYSFVDPRDHPPKVYPNVDIYMQHHKALLFESPKLAKALLKEKIFPDSQTLDRLDDLDAKFANGRWAKAREDLMERAIYCKFSFPVYPRHDEKVYVPAMTSGPKNWRLGDSFSTRWRCGISFRKMLLNTGNADLIEGDPNDRVWGLGYDGQYLTGKCLVLVRAKFQREEQSRITKKYVRTASDGTVTT